MRRPIALCLEHLDADADAEATFLQCVAVEQGEPGLTLGPRAGVRWRDPSPGGVQIGVVEDQRLVLGRPADGVPTTLRRGGRSRVVAPGESVVLLDQDELEVDGRRLRLHVHGEAPAVEAPAPLAPARPGGGLGRQAAATVMALGAAVGLVGADLVEPDRAPAPVPVRTRPPKVMAPRRDAGPPAPQAPTKKQPAKKEPGKAPPRSPKASK